MFYCQILSPNANLVFNDKEEVNLLYMVRAVFLTKEQEKHLIRLIRLGKKRNADSEISAKGKEAQKMLLEASKFLVATTVSYTTQIPKSPF